MSLSKRLEPLIRDLYAARNALKAECSDFPFTLDGKLIGDLGEAIAMHDLGLERLPPGSALHDFKTADGRLVQVKTTQAAREGQGVGLGLNKQSFQQLLVLQLSEEGTYSVLYDGPGHYIDEARRHKKSASLSVGQLRRLNAMVNPAERVIGDA
jgi:hypothetical protein